MTNNKPLIILGAGGHASVLIDALRACGREILGLTTKQNAAEREILGIPVLGDDAAVEAYPSAQIELVNGIGCLPGNSQRWRVADAFRRLGYRFARVVHPAAMVSANATLAEGVQVMAGSVVQTGASIGRDSIINTRCAIDHDCRIGDANHLSPGATLCGGVSTGHGVHIGTGATLIQQVTIGSGAVIGAGSLVLHDIPEFTRFLQPRIERLTPLQATPHA